MRLLYLALPALLLAGGPTAAQAPRPEQRLQGELLMGGATLVDPPPGEPRDSHAYFTITGEPARRLFNAMRAPVALDVCESGFRMRQQGGLTCRMGPRGREPSCAFSIDLRSGGFGPGRPC